MRITVGAMLISITNNDFVEVDAEGIVVNRGESCVFKSYKLPCGGKSPHRPYQGGGLSDRTGVRNGGTEIEQYGSECRNRK
jgi:hypothetical protein